jgi:branched-chain amino acid transport system ATP-binding protein
MPSSEPLLTTRDVSISFGGVRALRGVSMDIPAGAIVAVIGPNGAGKTTLFNCITGVYKPDAGDVRFAGEPLVGKKPHEVAALGLARTFQNIELFARMTVLDNVLLGRHRHMKTGPLSAMLFGRGVKREEVAQRKRVEHILDFLDLQFTRDRFVGQLPYGVRKKIELARALALEPKLLLLATSATTWASPWSWWNTTWAWSWASAIKSSCSITAKRSPTARRTK